ncbi:MAG TPA: CBS domain-containing protein [Candidatus Aminicenantes bacterium]|nr:CBS domain-containing protein [Candidatus Aminicenantes bacterium]HPS78666.1 CBS domain-containing protein [Thermoanaerobaculaceae bacterium]
MDTIKRILQHKGDAVYKVPPEATVMQAVEAMSKRQVGAVLVCAGCECAGIFTERDLMSRVVLAGLDPAATRVNDVMTAEVACVEPSTRASEAMAIMTERRCRHLPVVENGAIVGMVSIGDLVRLESENQQFEIRMLTDYIHGKYPG